MQGLENLGSVIEGKQVQTNEFSTLVDNLDNSKDRKKYADAIDVHPDLATTKSEFHDILGQAFNAMNSKTAENFKTEAQTDKQKRKRELGKGLKLDTTDIEVEDGKIKKLTAPAMAYLLQTYAYLYPGGLTIPGKNQENPPITLNASNRHLVVVDGKFANQAATLFDQLKDKPEFKPAPEVETKKEEVVSKIDGKDVTKGTVTEGGEKVTFGTPPSEKIITERYSTAEPKETYVKVGDQFYKETPGANGGPNTYVEIGTDKVATIKKEVAEDRNEYEIEVDGMTEKVKGKTIKETVGKEITETFVSTDGKYKKVTKGSNITETWTAPTPLTYDNCTLQISKRKTSDGETTIIDKDNIQRDVSEVRGVNDDIKQKITDGKKIDSNITKKYNIENGLVALKTEQSLNGYKLFGQKFVTNNNINLPQSEVNTMRGNKVGTSFDIFFKKGSEAISSITDWKKEGNILTYKDQNGKDILTRTVLSGGNIQDVYDGYSEIHDQNNQLIAYSKTEKNINSETITNHYKITAGQVDQTVNKSETIQDIGDIKVTKMTMPGTTDQTISRKQTIPPANDSTLNEIIINDKNQIKKPNDSKAYGNLLNLGYIKPENYKSALENFSSTVDGSNENFQGFIAMTNAGLNSFNPEVKKIASDQLNNYLEANYQKFEDSNGKLATELVRGLPKGYLIDNVFKNENNNSEKISNSIIDGYAKNLKEITGLTPKQRRTDLLKGLGIEGKEAQLKINNMTDKTLRELNEWLGDNMFEYGNDKPALTLYKSQDLSKKDSKFGNIVTNPSKNIRVYPSKI